MSDRLPPLNALRAFEAAARRGSFRDAAAELHVTPAAISHQIKALEDHLGAALFRRLNREVRLTDPGRACLPGVRAGFEQIAGAMALLRRKESGGILTVSTAPSLAAKWLLPRLDRLRARHPEIDLRLDASTGLVDFARDDVHVGLRYGRGEYPGLYSELLLRTEVFPVCAPALLRGKQGLRAPADLRRFALIHEDSGLADPTHPDWTMWLRAAGLSDINASPGPRFTQSQLVLDAAIAGHGVALARDVIAADDLANGRLVRPFNDAVKVDFAFYFVAPPVLMEQPKVKAFHDWIFAEASAAAVPPPRGKQSGRARLNRR